MNEQRQVDITNCSGDYLLRVTPTGHWIVLAREVGVEVEPFFDLAQALVTRAKAESTEERTGHERRAGL